MTRDLTLWALARCPFLPADDLALLAGTGIRAAHAQLTRLVRAGLVESLHPCGTRLHLYYLSPAGVTAAARAAGTSPAALNARYGLGERALRRRLPSLERLVASRRILLALHHALAARGGALEGWRAWPVPWPYTRGSRQHLLHLDGEGTLALMAASSERRPFGLLWDGDACVPMEVLAKRLAHLDLLCASPTYDGPGTPRVPPVLLVSAAAERVPPGYRPGLLWTTQAEIARYGPLAACWHGSALVGRTLPLADALAACGGQPGDPLVGLPISRGTVVGPVPRGQQPFQNRIDALRAGTGADSDFQVLTLAIPPRSREILTAVGQHPLLPAAEITVVCALNPTDVWTLLGVLRQHNLVIGWTPPGNSRGARYILTARGVRLLAARMGLEPAAYRRIYAVLDETPGRRRRGLRFAQRNLAHTDGINHTFLALLEATRAVGGSLDWKGEWACTRRFLVGPRLRTLRPDAEARYEGPGGRQRLFVEVDRGTKRLQSLEGKLINYATYCTRSDCNQVTLLLVTTGSERGWELLRLNETLLEQVGLPPLDLLVTTLAEISRHGAQARLWHTSTGPCAPLHAAIGLPRPTVDVADATPLHDHNQ